MSVQRGNLPFKYLTEYQVWTLRDALAYGAVYYPDANEGMFPKPNEKGMPLHRHDRTVRAVVKRLLQLGLLHEQAQGRFILTELGSYCARQEGEITIRRSY